MDKNPTLETSQEWQIVLATALLDRRYHPLQIAAVVDRLQQMVEQGSPIAAALEDAVLSVGAPALKRAEVWSDD